MENQVSVSQKQNQKNKKTNKQTPKNPNLPIFVFLNNKWKALENYLRNYKSLVKTYRCWGPLFHNTQKKIDI